MTELDEAGALAAITALAQETRLRALRSLPHAFPDGMPAGRLAAAVGCAPSTLTFHLRQLQRRASSSPGARAHR